MATEDQTVGESSASTLAQQCNIMFQHRFTDQDQLFMKTMATRLPHPPCVDNWYRRPKRTYDYPRGRGRGQDDRRNDMGHRGGHYSDRGNPGDRDGYHRYEQHRGGHHGNLDNYQGHRERQGGYHSNNSQSHHRDYPGNQGGYRDGRQKGGYRDDRQSGYRGNSTHNQGQSRTFYAGVKRPRDQTDSPDRGCAKRPTNQSQPPPQ